MGSGRGLQPWLLPPRSSPFRSGPRVPPGVPGAPGHGDAGSVLVCSLGAESRRQARRCGPGKTSGRGCSWIVLQGHGCLIRNKGKNVDPSPCTTSHLPRAPLSSVTTQHFNTTLEVCSNGEIPMWLGAFQGGHRAGVASSCPELSLLDRDPLSSPLQSAPSTPAKEVPKVKR